MKDFLNHEKNVAGCIENMLRCWCLQKSLEAESCLIMQAIESCGLLKFADILVDGSDLFDLLKRFWVKLNHAVNLNEQGVRVQRLLNEIEAGQNVLVCDN